jgi:integrase
LKFVSGVALPDPLPFAGLEFYPRESMRYHSRIDPQALLRRASQELAESDSDSFLVLVLALGAGLRRGEIDHLLWRQMDFRTGLIHVEVTEAGSLKSADSQGAVAIDEALSSVLQGFRAKAKSDFVIEEGSSSTGSSKPWGRRYRCQGVFERLMLWLRKNGIESRAPIHTLRKEAGSIVSTQSGIHAASLFLRHADMQVTSQFYADHKERVTIDMSALLPPANVVSLKKINFFEGR